MRGRQMQVHRRLPQPHLGFPRLTWRLRGLLAAVLAFFFAATLALAVRVVGAVVAPVPLAAAAAPSIVTPPVTFPVAMPVAIPARAHRLSARGAACSRRGPERRGLPRAQARRLPQNGAGGGHSQHKNITCRGPCRSLTCGLPVLCSAPESVTRED